MTAEIIRLADHRKPKRYLLAERPAEGTGDLIALQAALAAIAIATLSTAAIVATTPMWPGGIDDLEWWR